MKKKVGILMISFVMMSYMGISPVLASIAEEFPNVNQSLIQMIITLPNLLTLVTTLIAGKLVTVVYKRTLTLVAVGLYIIGGLMPIFYNNSVYFLLCCTAIMGLGGGLISTTIAGLICDYFEGDERNMLMGVQGACIALGAMIFIMLGGILSSFGWRRVYLAYLLLIPVFIGIYICLPQGKLERPEEGKTRSKMPPYVFFMCTIGFLFYILQNVFNTNISLFMMETRMGTDQTSSVATMFSTLAGIAGGVTVSANIKRLGKYVVAAAMALTAVGMLAVYMAGSLPIVILGGVLVGYSFSTFAPACTCFISDKVDLTQRSMAIALMNASTNLGSAISPVVVNAVTGVFAPTVRARFLMSAIVLTVVIVGSLAKVLTEKE